MGVQTKPCNTQACPVNCKVSEWEKWGACSKKCGTGIRERKREVTSRPQFGGLRCPRLVAKERCNVLPCPVDCKVSEWKKWESCTKSCGGGTNRRERAIVTINQYGGKSCGKTSETKTCNEKHCPVDCKVSEWKWQSCSKTCGAGSATAIRAVLIRDKYGGKSCPSLSQ